jgi:hypothetical protein
VLEHQLAKIPLYFDVVNGFRPQLVDDCFEVPDTPGLGVELADDVLSTSISTAGGERHIRSAAGVVSTAQ